MRLIAMQTTIDYIAKVAPHKLSQLEALGTPTQKQTKDKVKYYEFEQFKN